MNAEFKYDLEFIDEGLNLLLVCHHLKTNKNTNIVLDGSTDAIREIMELMKFLEEVLRTKYN